MATWKKVIVSGSHSDLLTVTASQGLMVGDASVTSTAAELNILDGVTSTASELNLVDGSSAGSIVNSKAVIYSSGGQVNGTSLAIGGTAITSTAAELNALDGITAVVGELNALDIGSTAVGTAVASKAVILDSNKDYTGIRNLTVSGELDAATGDFSGAVDIAGDLTLSAGTDGALTFGAASSIKIVDNNDAALVIEEADTAYMTFTTTNESEVITAAKKFNAAGGIQIGGTTVNSTAAELNILDGVTSTASELNLVDGSSAGSIVNSKAVIYSSGGQVNGTSLAIGGTAITSTAAELNILDGVTSTAAELNIIDGNTSATSTTIADADRIVLNDNGTMVQVAVTDMATYIGAGAADDISAGDAAVSISTTSGNVTIDSNAGAVSIDGHTGVTLASSNSGDITLDSVADINLDAAGNDIKFKAGGTHVLSITNSSSDVIIKPIVDAKDLIFQQRDGTAVLTIEDNATANIPDGKLALGGTAVTSTAAELNTLDGITAVVGELNALDIGSTAVGTAVASKAVILDSNKDYTGIRNLTVSGELDAATGDFSGAVDIAGNLVVQGDLLVSGDVTEVNTANLNVEDQFILLNSGSINTDVGIIFGGTHGTVNTGKALVWDHAVNHGGGADGRLAVKTNATAANTTTAFAAGTTGYYLAGVFQGSTADAATALADHAGNIRIESNELFMYF
jgi:hypothetical protein